MGHEMYSFPRSWRGIFLPEIATITKNAARIEETEGEHPVKKILALLAVIAVLSGCAPFALTGGADRVPILQDREDFRDCAHVGEAIGVAGSWWYYWAVSNHALTQWARNDLRNQTVGLGGNRIRIENHDNYYATSSVFIGQVYRCPEAPQPSR
jgi:hypothetical protein